jgi:predicted nucleic acid-binding protein
VTVAWETTLVSHLRPGSEAHEHCVEQATVGDEVVVAAGALLETAYGYELERVRRPEFADFLRWLEHEVAAKRLFVVVPMDGHAALVAGRLRARAPHPPSPEKGDRRTKARRRAAWHLDLQIAATCWTAGFDVATENRRDFEQIADLIAELAPDAPRLEVVDSPI